jgi:hypothetical protein
MKYFIIAIALMSSQVFAARPKAEFNKTELDESLEILTYSINENNLEDFLSCFSSSKRESLRKKAAHMFLLHPEIRMDIENYFILSEDENKKEIMIRYNLGKYTVISEMTIIREDEKLIINNETITFKEDRFSDEGRRRVLGLMNGDIN